MRERLRNQSGITLLEIMVTVVIVGIVSAMAVPQFNKAIDRLNFSTATRSMKSTIKLARSMSISDKSPYGVHFNPENLTVSIFKEMGDITEHSFGDTDSLIRVDTLPRQVNFLWTNMQNDVILFRPNGSAEFGGEPSLSTLGITGSMVAVSDLSVLAATGRLEESTHWY